MSFFSVWWRSCRLFVTTRLNTRVTLAFSNSPRVRPKFHPRTDRHPWVKFGIDPWSSQLEILPVAVLSISNDRGWDRRPVVTTFREPRKPISIFPRRVRFSCADASAYWRFHGYTIPQTRPSISPDDRDDIKNVELISVDNRRASSLLCVNISKSGIIGAPRIATCF